MGSALRRAILPLEGLPIPLSRHQETLTVDIPCRGFRGPLHLLADSTGIKFEGEGERHACKYGGPKQRVWRKIHLYRPSENLLMLQRRR